MREFLSFLRGDEADAGFERWKHEATWPDGEEKLYF